MSNWPVSKRKADYPHKTAAHIATVPKTAAPKAAAPKAAAPKRNAARLPFTQHNAAAHRTAAHPSKGGVKYLSCNRPENCHNVDVVKSVPQPPYPRETNERAKQRHQPARACLGQTAAQNNFSTQNYSTHICSIQHTVHKAAAPKKKSANNCGIQKRRTQNCNTQDCSTHN